MRMRPRSGDARFSRFSRNSRYAAAALASFAMSSLQLSPTGSIAELPAARAQEARLRLQNNPLDRGGSYDIFYTPATSLDFYAAVSGNLIQGNPDFVAFFFNKPNPGNANTFVNLRFQTSESSPAAGLTPGTTYTNVQHYTDTEPGFAGMGIGFQNTSFTIVSGQFTINHLSLLPERDRFGLPQLAYFHASFTTYGGIIQEPPDPLRGTIEYSATTLSSAPEPGSLSLLFGAAASGVLYLAARRRHILT